MASASPVCLGFVTVVQEPLGYVGGLLVTNPWGRPLEFRLSSPVQPNRVQQILYGPALERYVCADVIGKALIEKTSSVMQALVSDRVELLEARCHVKAPLVCLCDGAAEEHTAWRAHPQHPQDAEAVRALLRDSTLDLAEPFVRIREALAEARKLGLTRPQAA